LFEFNDIVQSLSPDNRCNTFSSPIDLQQPFISSLLPEIQQQKLFRMTAVGNHYIKFTNHLQRNRILVPTMWIYVKLLHSYSLLKDVKFSRMLQDLHSSQFSAPATNIQILSQMAKNLISLKNCISHLCSMKTRFINFIFKQIKNDYIM